MKIDPDLLKQTGIFEIGTLPQDYVANKRVFALEEWRAKLEAKSSFVLDVLSKPKLFLIGTQRELDQLAKSGQDRSA